jgi:hypothetical protein
MLAAGKMPATTPETFHAPCLASCPGPDAMHVFTVTSEQPARLLVIYSPPYGEDPARVRRD